MSTALFGWSVSDIALIISRCDKLCSAHANSGGAASQFDHLIEQVKLFKSVWKLLRDEIQPLGTKVYIAHTPIVKTLGECQAFLARFTVRSQPVNSPRLSASHWVPGNEQRAEYLQIQLNSHTQQLQIYLDLLQQ
jgi:hypothetical protein